MQLRVRALETVLAEKGYIDPAALDVMIEAFETRIGPHNGARVVAKAWADPAFKHALIEDATKAVQSLGLINRVGDHLIEPAVEPRQRFGDAIGRRRRGHGRRRRRARSRRRIGTGHARELPRQVVKTLIDGGEVVGCDLIVVVRLSI